MWFIALLSLVMRRRVYPLEVLSWSLIPPSIQSPWVIERLSEEKNRRHIAETLPMAETHSRLSVIFE